MTEQGMVVRLVVIASLSQSNQAQLAADPPIVSEGVFIETIQEGNKVVSLTFHPISPHISLLLI